MCAFTHEDADASADVVEGTILISDVETKTIFYPESTHSFVSHAFARNIDGGVEKLDLALVVQTPVGMQVCCHQYFPSTRVQVEDFILPTDLILLSMKDFDIILGMDWLATYRAVMDYFNKTIKLTLQSDIIEFVGQRKSIQNCGIFALKAKR